jgi:carbamoyltransferase
MYILGISEGHNSSACLMKDGVVIAATHEERFTKIKNQADYPKEAIDYCLKEAGISGGALDVVAMVNTHINLIWIMLERESRFTVADYVFEQHHYFKPLILEKRDPKEVMLAYVAKLKQRFGKFKTTHYDFSGLNDKNILDASYHCGVRKQAVVRHLKIDPQKIRIIDHHACHRHYAYYSSPFRGETLILTADGVGDRGVNATVAVVKKDKIDLLFETTNCQIARIYRYITLYLGMKPLDHEFKVMGLAPYSNAKELERAYEVFKDILKVKGLDFVWKNRPKDLYFHFHEALEGCRFDGIAGALQKMTEELMRAWVKNAIKETGIPRVVFSGGVAMNIKVNMILANMPEVKSIFVGPSPSDESNAIGACFFVMDEYCETHKLSKDVIKKITHAYLGPAFTSDEVARAIKKTRAQERYFIKRGVTNKRVAKLLAQGKIVGMCRGRMEFGQRALGNRSILADPRNPDIVRKINHQIKYRDFWMPFTPSILAERADDYVKNPKKLDLPFMTIGLLSKQRAQKELMAALHPADLTARPQFVKKEINPEYHDLIKEFEKITQVGGLLNTSLNLHGHPMVNTPEDAIGVMDRSELDVMYFGDILLERKI